MNCPVCGDAMREIDKYGVKLDICTGCKGIWLDRGELEKIVDLAGGRETSERRSDFPDGRPEDRAGYDARYERRDHHEGHHEHSSDDHDRHHHDHGWGHGKRRKGWLSELFDD